MDLSWLLKNKDIAFFVSEILKTKYPIEKNNIIEITHNYSTAIEKLKKHYKHGLIFDIIILDLETPINIRRVFIKTVKLHQKNYECIIATDSYELKKDEKRFIKDNNALLISELNEIMLFPLLENIIEKKFNEKKYNLIRKIGGIFNLNLKSQEILKEIVTITLQFLDLKICSITLIDHKNNKLKIGALTGFGKHQKRYMQNFNILGLFINLIYLRCAVSL